MVMLCECPHHLLQAGAVNRSAAWQLCSQIPPVLMSNQQLHVPFIAWVLPFVYMVYVRYAVLFNKDHQTDTQLMCKITLTAKPLMLLHHIVVDLGKTVLCVNAHGLRSGQRIVTHH